MNSNYEPSDFSDNSEEYFNNKNIFRKSTSSILEILELYPIFVKKKVLLKVANILGLKWKILKTMLTNL